MIRVSRRVSLTLTWRARGRISRLLAGLLAALAMPVLALPTGQQVVSGSVAVQQAGSNTLNIRQGSSQGIIDWRSYNIGAGETVNYLQPGSSSVTLNRVIGNDMSRIFGNLNANGQVFIINPNGILFGRGAQVDVGGLVGSTLGLSDSAFLARQYHFDGASSAGSVVNLGNLKGRYVVLNAPQINNAGTISTPAGTTALSAGERVSVDLSGDGLVSVSVDRAAAGAAITSSGSIQADGGQVLLQAHSADALLDTVLNVTGVVRARSLSERNGSILLDGGTAGIVHVSGALEASGLQAGERGGSIKVLGRYVGLFAGARLDARGDTGGGSVLVGGNFHGAGSEYDATRSYVEAGASIDASALRLGNGGQVVVWSNDATLYRGSIAAQGGALGGDGGQVEVSGKQLLGFSGAVTTLAARGRVGSLLLDPNDVTISAGPPGGALLISGTTANGTDTFATPGSGTASYYINQSTLEALGATTNIAVTATGNISFQFSGTGALAGGGLNLATVAGHNITFTGLAITMNTASLTTSGGDVVFNIGAGVSDLGAITTAGGGLTINNAGAVTQTAGFNLGAGALTKHNAGLLTLSAANTYTGGTTADGGSVTISDSGALGASGSINFSGSSKLTVSNVALARSVGLSTATLALDGTGSVSAVTGSAGTLDYSTHTGTVTFDLANGSAATTGISTTWAGLTHVVGNAAAASAVTGNGLSWTLTNGTPDAASVGGVSWTGFPNLTDAGIATFHLGTSGSVTGALASAAGGTLDYSSYGSNVAFDVGTGVGTGAPTTSGITTVTGNPALSNTIHASAQTWTLLNSTADAGSVAGVHWTGFRNLADTGSGYFQMGASGRVTGTLSSGAGGTLDYSTYSSNVSYNVSTGAATGTGGTSGITTVSGNPAKVNTIAGTGASYSLSTTFADAGTDGTVSWSNFRNVTDAGAGVVNIASGASLTGSVSTTGGTLDYTGYTTPVTVDLSAHTATGIAGTYSGISTITGGSGANAIHGSGVTYRLTAANAGDATVATQTTAWTNFGTVADGATGTFALSGTAALSGSLSSTNRGTVSFGGPGTFDISAGTAVVNAGPAITATNIGTVTGNGSTVIAGSGLTYQLTGSNSGNEGSGAAAVSWTGVATINDAAAGTFNMGSAGAVTGSLTAVGGALDYRSYASNVSYNLSTNAASGVAGGATGITLVQANPARSNTIAGNGATYALTGADAGNGTTVSWTGFGNLADVGAAIIHGGAGSLSGTLSDSNAAATATLDGVITAATINFASKVSLAGDTTLHATSGTTDLAAIDGAQTLIVQGGVIRLHGAVGSGAALNGLTIDDSGTASASNTIALGTGVLTKQGAGTLTLSAAGTYSGGTTVSNGSVVAATSGALGSGTATLASGTTLTLSDGTSETVAVQLNSATLALAGTATTSGAVTASTAGTLDYTSYSAPVNFSLAGTATGTGGWSGLTSVVGNGGTATVSGSNASYTLSGLNAGSSGSLGWTHFNNLADSGAGHFSFTTGSVGGNIVASGGTLDYAAAGGAVHVNLNGASSGATSGIGGTWTGISHAVGNGSGATILGSGATYALSGANAASSGTLAWTGFQNLQDAGAGIFNMGTNGSVSGTISAVGGSASYAGYATPVSFALTGSGTGIGHWSGISSVTGSGASTDTIVGSANTYHLTGANAGNAAGVSWTSFENLQDSGAGTFDMASAGSVTGTLTAVGGTLNYAGYATPVTVGLNGTATGTGGWSGITTLVGSAGSDTLTGSAASYTLSGANAGNSGALAWSSFEVLNDAGAGTFNVATGGSLSGALSAVGGTLSYASYSGPVALSLGGSATGLTAGFTGITTLVGNQAATTLSGSNATYALTGANSGSSGGLAWSGVGNLADSAAGIFNVGSAGSLSGNLSAVGGTLSYAAFGGPVNFGLNGQGTSIGQWSGITSVTGNGSASTLSGNGASYQLAGSNAGHTAAIAWTGFGNIADTGTSTIVGTGATLTGALDTAATTLSGQVAAAAMHFGGAVTLAADTTLAASGQIAATGGIDGAHALSMHAGSFSLGGPLGAGTALSTLSIVSDGSVALPEIHSTSAAISATGNISRTAAASAMLYVSNTLSLTSTHGTIGVSTNFADANQDLIGAITLGVIPGSVALATPGGGYALLGVKDRPSFDQLRVAVANGGLIGGASLDTQSLGCLASVTQCLSLINAQVRAQGSLAANQVLTAAEDQLRRDLSRTDNVRAAIGNGWLTTIGVVPPGLDAIEGDGVKAACPVGGSLGDTGIGAANSGGC